MHICPNCSLYIQDSSAEICPQCKFNFNETLSCPYLISKRCVHSGEVCNVYGLDYEDCNTYLHKSGIKYK